jgi:hypothetical protein
MVVVSLDEEKLLQSLLRAPSSYYRRLLLERNQARLVVGALFFFYRPRWSYHHVDKMRGIMTAHTDRPPARK